MDEFPPLHDWREDVTLGVGSEVHGEKVLASTTVSVVAILRQANA